MLEDYLHSYFQDVELKKIFHDVIGTSDSKRVQTMLEKNIKQYFQAEIKKILFIESSIGVVFGLLLSTGKKVVLKVYSEKIALDYLEKMNAIQNIFYQEGFPAPEVLTPIFRFGKTFAGFYMLIEGIKADAHQKDIMLELAKGLADFSNIIDKHQIAPMKNFFQQAPKRNLWPRPHNILFDLKKTSQGAGWIAEHAKKAKKILVNSNLLKKLAHTDWGTKNALFKEKKLIGIFDWDSLGAMSECQMLGQAAAQFTADWESGFKITPTPYESKQFIKAYGYFRQKKFNEQEYMIISAASDYIIAIIARFEHAGGGKEHPYQDLMRACGQKSFLLA